MKKIIAASLFAGLFSSVAFATPAPSPDITVDLTGGGYKAIGTPTGTGINLARSGLMQAQASRAGFVKNNFEFLISHLVLNNQHQIHLLFLLDFY